MLIYSIIISAVQFFSSYASYSCLQIVAERLSFQLRSKYLAALMRQEIAFFERQQVEALPSKMAEYFTLISSGIGEKLGQFLVAASATVTGLVLGVCVNPQYGGILLTYLPLGYLFMSRMQNAMVKKIVRKMGFNAKLGGFTEELLSTLKLIISFGKEEVKLNEYRN